jgi:hypothetical protein
MDLNCPRDFYVHVDALYMQAKEDGLDFAISDSSDPTATGPITHGRIEGFSNDNHDFDWNPGMRFGFGFYLDHDAWCLDFNWTWLNITNYKHANATTTGGAEIPMWALGLGTPAANIGPRTSAVWNTDYNTFDIRLTKPYYISRYLVVNPHFGVRGGWIDQHFSVDMGGHDSRTIFHSNNDYWGVGARAGLDSDWIIGKGWSLFGNIAAAMLFGKFDVDQNYSLPGATADGYNIDHHSYQNTPNFEIALGIAWGKYFNKKRNHVGLKLAYEFHEWWDQLNLRKFYSGGVGLPTTAPAITGIYVNEMVTRNFTLNGLSLKLQFDI